MSSLMQPGVLPPGFGLLERPTWQLRAACRGKGADLFFPLRGQQDAYEAARTVCATCPVTEQCLEFALADPATQGMWAGTTAQDRKAMHRAARAPAA